MDTQFDAASLYFGEERDDPRAIIIPARSDCGSGLIEYMYISDPAQKR